VGRFPSFGRQLGEALALWRLPGLRHLQERETRSQRYLEEQSVDWVVGAFLAVRAEAAAQVGELDERFFLYSEEKDWCYRIRAAGWDVRHLPHIAVIHHTGGYDRPGLKAQLSYSKLLFAHKHFGPARRTGIRAALALQHGARALALAGRHVTPRWRTGRLRNELEALALVLGRAEPPFR
jgi:N-acetylglucosaminyl-diphospho-decaprenol L-rhamnosyltransferase